MAEGDFLTGVVLVSSIEAIGRTAVIARDGDALLSLIEKHSPELVIFDMNFARPGALQMLRTLRQRATPVLATLRIGQAKLRAAARALGVSSFLEMPFAPGELRERIESAARVPS